MSIVTNNPQCLKITEKSLIVNSAKESKVFILSGQKFIKNTKNRQFGEFLKAWSFELNSVTRLKLVENAKIELLNETFYVIFKQ